MNWNNNWDNGQFTHNQSASSAPIQATNPLDSLNQDQLLVLWADKKKALATIKEEEMDLRKYIVSRAFPNAEEGTNTISLGQGYELKAKVSFNYKLEDNKKVEEGLNKIEAIGNQGKFIADRLVSWTPNFLLKEFRVLQEEAKEGSQEAKQILAIVNEFLIIDNAAPTLEIKEPKAKKK